MLSTGLNARTKKKLRSNFILNRVSALQKAAHAPPQRKTTEGKNNFPHADIIFHILIHDANIPNI